jgi:L-Ala-D/L-Glu epimerase
MDKIRLTAQSETWPIRGSFNIARGARTQADVVVCRIERNGRYGLGECVPYARYGETVESVLEQIHDARALVESGSDRMQIIEHMPAGAARNAIDCALWDLKAKLSGVPVHMLVCRNPPRPVDTAMTISLGDPEDMALQARRNAQRPLLKVKLGGNGDIERIHAVATAAPGSKLIIDANESWTEENLPLLMREAASVRVALIEQPLPAGKDGFLAHIPHPVPICADESAHVTGDLAELRHLYDCVNIKLDKAGGLTEALTMREKAHELGFSVMVGCMVGTSLAMAPAVLLAQEAEFVDLDGPLILESDRPFPLSYSTSVVSPPSPKLWG